MSKWLDLLLHLFFNASWDLWRSPHHLVLLDHKGRGKECKRDKEEKGGGGFMKAFMGTHKGGHPIRFYVACKPIALPCFIYIHWNEVHWCMQWLYEFWWYHNIMIIYLSTNVLNIHLQSILKKDIKILGRNITIWYDSYDEYGWSYGHHRGDTKDKY